VSSAAGLARPLPGYGCGMTTPDDDATLDDVMETEESAPRDRSQHAKGYDRPDDDVLQHRTEQERQLVGSDDADPAGAEEHSATD
jgi:hypothetical protein